MGYEHALEPIGTHRELAGTGRTTAAAESVSAAAFFVSETPDAVCPFGVCGPESGLELDAESKGRSVHAPAFVLAGVPGGAISSPSCG